MSPCDIVDHKSRAKRIHDTVEHGCLCRLLPYLPHPQRDDRAIRPRSASGRVFQLESDSKDVRPLPNLIVFVARRPPYLSGNQIRAMQVVQRTMFGTIQGVSISILCPLHNGSQATNRQPMCRSAGLLREVQRHCQKLFSSALSYMFRELRDFFHCSRRQGANGTIRLPIGRPTNFIISTHGCRFSCISQKR